MLFRSEVFRLQNLTNGSMENNNPINPFALDDLVVRDLAHVWVERRAPVHGSSNARAVFEKTYAKGYGYWTERELGFFNKFSYHQLKHVVRAQRIDAVSNDEATRLVVGSVTTQDAGLTIEQWLAIRPRYANGQVLAHPFQSAQAFVQLTRACLLALQEIHSHGIVHCDIKADNICIPYSP